MGMEPVSLDSPAKQDNFNRLIAQDAQRYFWTGENTFDNSNTVLDFFTLGKGNLLRTCEIVKFSFVELIYIELRVLLDCMSCVELPSFALQRA